MYALKNNEIVGSSIFKNIVDATIMFLNNKFIYFLELPCTI